MFKRSLARAVVLAFLLVPIGSSAGTIYNFTSGSAVISATIIDTLGGSPPTPVLLNGSPTVSVGVIGDFVDFDDSTPELVDFLVELADTGVLNLSPSVFGYVSAELNGLTIAPGVGFDGTTGVSGGPNNFTFSVPGVDVNATLTATSGSPPLPPDLAGVPISQTGLTLDGNISVGANQIELLGITLGAIPNPTLPTEILVFKGDIVFNGSVPEPGVMLLLGGALALLAVRRR